VALRHPEWLASKMIIKVHKPRGGAASEEAVTAEEAVPISAYSPRRAKRMNDFKDR
jgi:hypothetical protein